MDRPTEPPFTDRTYRRWVGVRPRPGGADAEMEDDVHHLTVRLDHEDGVVTGASVSGLRAPWHTCPGGARGVAALVGTALADAVRITRWSADLSTEWAHVRDLAVLAASHARDDHPVDFEVLIPQAASTHGWPPPGWRPQTSRVPGCCAAPASSTPRATWRWTTGRCWNNVFGRLTDRSSGGEKSQPPPALVPPRAGMSWPVR